MQFHEISWNDPISIMKANLIDLENANEKLRNEMASYTRSIKKDDKTVCKVDPKYEARAKEIADKIAANKLKTEKIRICLDEIDKMFRSFPDGLRTWDDLINQKQSLERKKMSPEQFVCFIDWSKKEQIAKLDAEHKRKQAELLAQLAVIDECIRKIRPLLFGSGL